MSDILPEVLVESIQSTFHQIRHKTADVYFPPALYLLSLFSVVNDPFFNSVDGCSPLNPAIYFITKAFFYSKSSCYFWEQSIVAVNYLNSGSSKNKL